MIKAAADPEIGPAEGTDAAIGRPVIRLLQHSAVIQQSLYRLQISDLRKKASLLRRLSISQMTDMISAETGKSDRRGGRSESDMPEGTAARTMCLRRANIAVE